MPVPAIPDSPPASRTAPTIDTLLRLVPDKPASVSAALADFPSLAPASDASGYSLLHAAASYGQLDLLRELVRVHGVDVETRDGDGETALFAAESVAVVKVLVEELGADAGAVNEEGGTAEQAAAENVAEGEGGEWAGVLAYLEGKRGGSAAAGGHGGGRELSPRVPDGLQVAVGTVDDMDGVEGEPDPEFRRRIEELASRDDFQGPEGQAALRDLVRDAMGGLAADRDVRRRTD